MISSSPTLLGVILLPDVLQRVAFAVLTAGSVWSFYRTLDQRLLSHFPKSWSFQPGPTAKRLWRTFTEVVLQTRVIRDRPVNRRRFFTHLLFGDL